MVGTDLSSQLYEAKSTKWDISTSEDAKSPASLGLSIMTGSSMFFDSLSTLFLPDHKCLWDSATPISFSFIMCTAPALASDSQQSFRCTADHTSCFRPTRLTNHSSYISCKLAALHIPAAHISTVSDPGRLQKHAPESCSDGHAARLSVLTASTAVYC